jgi:hypothetical protein
MVINNTSEDYAIQYCAIHNITIWYFKSNKILNETQCWECVRQANKKKIVDISLVMVA